MRVKTLAAAAGVAALTAVIAVPGISNASRLNTRTEPQVQTDTTTTTEPVVETTTTQPVETTTTTTQPVVVEPTTQPKPVVTKLAAPAPVIVAPAPVVETPPAAPAPTVDVTKIDQPVPAPAPEQAGTDEKPADPCHMDDYHAVQVDRLDNPGEAARAHKVDRNGNGTVCRKDIPGRGRGNTGEGSNIKDDQAA
jgi:hypothetical protein